MPERDLVEVHREDLVLRELVLDLDRQEDLVDLPGPRLLGRQEDRARELLRERGGALRHPARRDVAQGGAADADEVDAAVVVEPRVLGGEERLDHHVRDVRALDEHAALDREARDDRAVGAAELRDDVGPVRRELGDLRNPDRAREGVSGADAEAGGEEDGQEQDGQGREAARAHGSFSH